MIQTGVGLVVCTHLWWSVQGPEIDPRAVDQGLLEASRAAVLALRPVLIIPGHGPAFSPHELDQ